MPGPGDTVMHAEVKIGDSILMLSDEFPDWGQLGPISRGGTTCTMMLYVEDCDAAFQRAVDAGCTATQQPKDEFWGDRFAKVTDPFGHQWAFATHVEDVSPEEMAEADGRDDAEGLAEAGEGGGRGSLPAPRLSGEEVSPKGETAPETETRPPPGPFRFDLDRDERLALVAAARARAGRPGTRGCASSGAIHPEGGRHETHRPPPRPAPRRDAPVHRLRLGLPRVARRPEGRHRPARRHGPRRRRLCGHSGRPEGPATQGPVAVRVEKEGFASREVIVGWHRSGAVWTNIVGVTAGGSRRDGPQHGVHQLGRAASGDQRRD